MCSSPAITDGQVSNPSIVYKPRDVVTITCNSGYAPSSLTTTCQSDRSWVPQPLCRYVSCQVPTLHNGFYKINGAQTNTSTTLPYGAIIQPQCSQPGYTPSPSSARICQEDRHWCRSDPSCIPSITCNSVPSLRNGYYDDGSNNAPYVYNGGISPKCNDGYNLNGSSLTRRCISNSTWSGEDPKCLIMTCSAPSMPINGRYNDSKSTYDYGDILVLICDNGYYVSSNADMKRTCVEKDTWSGSDLICQRIICFQPSTMSNGRYIKSQSIYDFESVIQPLCNQGYFISNNVTQRVCEHYNTWSGDEPYCSIETCNRPASTLNGWNTPNQTIYDYNTTIVITCNDGYEVKEGPVRRTCFENGTWGPVSFDCVKIICNDTVNVRHGISRKVGRLFIIRHSSTCKKVLLR